MSITIGERSLATSRQNLDAALIATTGCTAAEHMAMLGGKSTPLQVAAALHPMLTDKDAPTVGDLASMIADADVLAVRQQVVALLAPVAEAAPSAAIAAAGAADA